MLLIGAILFLLSNQQASEFGSFGNRSLFTRALDEPNPATGLCECPETRDLVAIVWSCFSTLILCTWVAVHPNIPPPNLTWFRATMVRFGLMLATALAPELTVGWACRQWMNAKDVYAEMTSLYDENWTMTHAFYLTMGGFVLKDPSGKRMGVLSHHDIKTLCDDGYIDFPSISEDEINDKNKTDGLSKCIVVFQTTWFVVQFVARPIKGLAVTELEVVTLATCSLTAMMCYFWWYKPMDIQFQTPVYLKKSLPFSPTPPTPVSPLDEKIQEKVDDAADVEDAPPASAQSRGVEVQHYADDILRLLFPLSSSWPNRILVVLAFPVVFVALMYAAAFVDPSRKEEGAILRWVSGPEHKDYVDPDRPGWRDWPQNIPTLHSYALTVRRHYKLVATVVFASLVFGGIHFVAWPFNMPTLAEKVIWRTASIVLVVIPLFMSVGRPVRDFVNRQAPNTWSRRWAIVVILLFVIFMIEYPIARMAGRTFSLPFEYFASILIHSTFWLLDLTYSYAAPCLLVVVLSPVLFSFFLPWSKLQRFESEDNSLVPSSKETVFVEFNS